MSLLQMSISGAVLILFILFIRAVAVNRLPKRTFLILWWITILRLLIPVSVPSALSVYSFLERTAAHSGQTPIGNVMAMMQGETPAFTGELLNVPVSPIFAPFTIWLAGTLFFAAFFSISYLRCRLEFSMSLPVQNVFAEKWLKDHPLTRSISIRQSDRIFAPLTYGIFQPVILMPKTTNWKDTRQLQYIFLHEYIHIRQFDAAAKLIAAFALCVHWFNPLVWGMYLLFNRDMELACDESVVRLSGETAKKDYALMLIHMEAKKSGFMPFCNEFSKNAVEERITAIMKTKRPPMAAILISCLTVLAAISIFATSAAAPPNTAASHTPSAAETGIDKGKTGADAENSMSIIHESVELLYYENGWPYLHDILTNNTDRTITEMEYCMLAYDEHGTPLKLYWNFFDSSQKQSYDYLARIDGLRIAPHETADYHGGWSLYDGEAMENWPVIGNGERNQVAYSLFCLKQVVFEDGSTWNNPHYSQWFETYAGKEVRPEALRNYYPYRYEIE